MLSFRNLTTNVDYQVEWWLKGKEEIAYRLRLEPLYELDSLRRLEIEVVLADHFADGSELPRQEDVMIIE